MDINALNTKLNKFVKEKVPTFFKTLPDKVKEFPNLTLGEQIAYSCISLGTILIIVSLFLF